MRVYHNFFLATWIQIHISCSGSGSGSDALNWRIKEVISCVFKLETRHLDWHTRGGRRGYKVKFSFTQDGPKMLRLFAATVIGLDGSSYAQLDLPYYALSRIETLELLSCSADSAVSSFIGHCSPTLKELKVTGSQFSGDLLSQYSATFPLLKSLKLIRTQISNTGLCALLRMATHGKNLKNVELYFNPNITGQGLSEFSKSLVDLDSLNLSGCHLNDEGFLELFSHGKSNVKSLSVGYTITMSGVGLGKASIYFPQVQFVELYTPRETSQWTPAGFMNILKMCGPELRLVDVGPNLISTEVRTVLDERGISVVHNQQRKR